MRLATYLNQRVPNFIVHAMCELLIEAGLDWEDALRAAELDEEAAFRVGGMIPARKDFAFQVEFATRTSDREDLWVRASQAFTVASLGVRGLALTSAPTIQALVEIAVDATDIGSAMLDVTPLWTSEGELTGMELTYPVPEEMKRFSVYRDLIFQARIYPWLYGGPFPYTQVEAPLEPVPSELRDLYECTVVAGAPSLKIWWDPAASRRPLPFGNSFQYEAWTKQDNAILLALRASGDWPRRVTKAIHAAPARNRKLEYVAVELGVSPRTLRRKLALSGDDFAQVRDATLKDLACDLLLNSPHPVGYISRMLGYADPASFTVAFRRWCGMPPARFREAFPRQTAERARTTRGA